MGIPDVDHAPRLGHQRSPALVRVHIEGIRERLLHFFRAEPDNVLTSNRFSLRLMRKMTTRLRSKTRFISLTSWWRIFSPLDGPIQEPAILLMDAKAVFRLHFRLVFFQPVLTCSVFD